MALDFPDTPTVGATYTAGGIVWTWDGTKWAATGTSQAGVYLPLTGGTLTGPLTAPSATIQGGSIDNAVIGATTPAAANVTSLNGGQLAGLRNLIINGDFRIDQRFAGALQNPLVNNSSYLGDRWLFIATQAGKFQGQQTTAGFPGLPYCATATVIAAATLAASDYFFVQQAIEGLNCAHLQWGTASAKPVTLSFWIYVGVAGTHSGSVVNKAGNRGYPFSFTVPAANTSTFISLTIPGDTAGTWATDNTGGLLLRFNLGSGSSALGPANAWGSIGAVGTTGSVQLVLSAGASLLLTGVQLEMGSVATPFERRLIGTEMNLCQRYYQRYTTSSAGGITLSSYTVSGNSFGTSLPFPQMRAIPQGALIGTWTGANLIGQPSLTVLAPNIMYLAIGATAPGILYAQNPANGGFDLYAEL
jgi:hypothetical protein